MEQTPHPFAQASGSVTTTPTALSSIVSIDNLRKARGADITVYSQAVRANYHPGASGHETGKYIAANETFSLVGQTAVINCKLRSETGTATVDVTLWR